MNKLKTIIVAGFALAASATAVSAEGLYVGGQLGFSGGGGEFNNTGTDLIFGMGRVGSLAVGQEFGNARVEGEIALRKNNMDNFGGVPVSGDMSSTAFMVNGYYDFGGDTWFFRPYVGLGIGAANVTFTTPSVDDNTTTFAMQFMLGGTIPFTDNFAMTVDWRLFGAAPSFQNAVGTSFEQDYGTSSLMLGARYSF